MGPHWWRGKEGPGWPVGLEYSWHVNAIVSSRQIQRKELAEGVVLGDAGRPAVGGGDCGIEGGVGVG